MTISIDVKRMLDVMRVGIGLGDVLALDEDAAERAVGGGVEHVRNAQARLAVELHAPFLLEDGAHLGIRDVAVARQLMRERAHVARALHVVLAAQRVHADAFAADVARRHRDVGHRHDHRRALAVLGDAETVVDRGVAAGGIEAGRLAHLLRRNAGDGLERFGRILRPLDELLPAEEVGRLAAPLDELAVDQVLGRDDVADGVHDRDVGRGLQLQMVGRLDMRRAHDVDAARIDDDQLGALADTLLHARREHRMRRRSDWRR